MIAIIDYGMGNLGSIYNMFKKVGADSMITSSHEKIAKADKLVLPGVGSFDAAMKRIHDNNYFDLLNELVLVEKKQVLGICLGMQLLFESSEEGQLPGFSWIKGEVMNFKSRIPGSMKIPHMGWNDVTIINKSPLTKGFSNEMRFYFVHSYYAKVFDTENQMMICDYGISFDSAVHHENIYGVQFHPEKSHRYGMQLLKNFSKL
jgi:imidazole glycerol-phosphate synthase subunit HisH